MIREMFQKIKMAEFNKISVLNNTNTKEVRHEGTKN